MASSLPLAAGHGALRHASESYRANATAHDAHEGVESHGSNSSRCHYGKTQGQQANHHQASGLYARGPASAYQEAGPADAPGPVSYTHLRAHETRHDLVCRLLLEKKKKKK